MERVIFLLAAVGALAGGGGVIMSRQPVRSALALLLVLGSLAVMYLLLAAQFLAVLQVIIYAGAIVVLFLFVIMLLHARSGERRQDVLRWQRPASLVLTAILLAMLGYVLLPGPTGPAATLDPQFGTAEAVGRALFTTYLLPFEVASMVLLVGIIGAVVLGRPPAAASQPAQTPTPPSGRATGS